MKKFEVKKEDSGFKRNGLFYIGRPVIKKTMVIEFIFEENCWFNWLPDKDQYDINKLFGMTSTFSLNDIDAGLIGFYPNPDKQGYMYVTAYSNYGKDKVFIGDTSGENKKIWMAEIPVMYKGKAIITNLGNKWGFEIEGVKAQHDKKKMCSYRTVGPWIGGANNEEGPHGGKASQDMTLWVNYSFK